MGSSADLLLSSESLLTWQANASLPLRGRHCSNLLAAFSTHQTRDIMISKRQGLRPGGKAFRGLHASTEISFRCRQIVFYPSAHHAYQGMSCFHAQCDDIWHAGIWVNKLKLLCKRKVRDLLTQRRHATHLTCKMCLTSLWKRCVQCSSWTPPPLCRMSSWQIRHNLSSSFCETTKNHQNGLCWIIHSISVFWLHCAPTAPVFC